MYTAVGLRLLKIYHSLDRIKRIRQANHAQHVSDSIVVSVRDRFLLLREDIQEVEQE